MEEKKVRRLGSEKDPTKIDVRFIAAIQPEDLGNLQRELRERLGGIVRLPTLNDRIKLRGSKIFIDVLRSIQKKEDPNGNEMGLNRNSLDCLKNHKYKGNYRELENILFNGFVSARAENREIIEPQDLEFLDDQLEPEAGNIEKLIYIPQVPCETIKLKDIIGYAKGIAKGIEASIIEEKVLSILRSGRDLKSVLVSEGVPAKEYQNFWKKVTKMTGKSIRDLESAAKGNSKRIN